MYPILETERLFLKPLQESDINNMFALDSNTAVTATMENDTVTDLTKYQKDFEHAVNSGVYLAIWRKEDTAFIGFIAVYQYIKQNKINYSQMWTAIMPEYWSQGYCTEATKRILHFAFKGIKTPWLCANQLQGNPAAGTVLKHCGLSFYTTYKMQNQPYDQYRYTREDYFRHNNLSIDEANPYDYVFPIKTSPYSYDKPIRKIDYINYVEQPTGYLCGQAVIAMLADVSMNEVISVMQTDKGTSMSELRDALIWYGIKTATKARTKYTEGMELPECCILSVKLPGYGHWSLYYKGKFYDPEFGLVDKLPEQAKLNHFWKVVITSNPAV